MEGLDSNVVVGVATALLALGFGYIPGLRQWYEALDSVRKAQVMGALLIVAAIIVYAGACYSPWQAVVCAEEGFWALVKLLGLAVFANQGTYLLAVKPSRKPEERAQV